MIQIDMKMPNACSECEFATEPCGICAAKEMENSSKGIKSEDICTVPYCNHRSPSEIGYGKPDWCPLREEKGTCKETEKAVLKEIENIEIEYGGVSWWYVTEDCRCTVSHWDNYCRNCGRRLVWK